MANSLKTLAAVGLFLCAWAITGPDTANVVDAGIVSGIEAGDRLANVGILVERFAPDRDWYWLQCSGTMIDRDVFLTAGHCIAQNAGTVEYGVAFPAQIPIDQSSPFTVPIPSDVPVYRGMASYHPNFDLTALTVPDVDSFDVAVVKLTDPLAGMPAAQVAGAGHFETFVQAYEHRAIGLAGYGLTSFLPILGSQPFDWGRKRFTTGRLDDVFPAKVTVAPAPGQVCAGDSGGPGLPVVGHELSHPVRPYVNVVAAVISYTVLTDTALPCQTASILYRLDTPQARSFLAQFVTLNRGSD